MAKKADSNRTLRIQSHPDNSANQEIEKNSIYFHDNQIVIYLNQQLSAIELNPPRKITIEQLRKYDGYESVSDQDATEIIETLYRLAILSYLCYLQEAYGKPSEPGLAA